VNDICKRATQSINLYCPIMIRSFLRHESAVTFPSCQHVQLYGANSTFVVKLNSPVRHYKSCMNNYHTLLNNYRCIGNNDCSTKRQLPRLSDNQLWSRFTYQPTLRIQSRSFEYLIDPSAIANEKKGRRGKKNRERSKKSWNPSNRFVDRIRIQVQGGSGGKGSLSSEQVLSRKYKLRPDGGHGGNGGCIFLVANESIQGLRMSKKHYVADDGKNGINKNQHGRSGKNRIIQVPAGVVVKRILSHDEKWDETTKSVIKGNGTDDWKDDESFYDDGSDESFEANGAGRLSLESGKDYNYDSDKDDKDNNNDDSDYEEIWDDSGHDSGDVEYIEMLDSDDEDDISGGTATTTADGRSKIDLADLNTSGSFVMVARGGRGGLGTCNYANRHGPLPDVSFLVKRAAPIPGEIVHLELVLKLIADVGLVGFPNAGKSSLLRAVSAATPAVAPYPFTTLRPILGCVDYRDGYRIRVADIPGLIDGASEGRGKGFEFLRHIERTKVLLYMIDAAGVDGRDPIDDLYVLANELEAYGDGSLLDRRAIVVANKLDLFASGNSDKASELLTTLTDTAEEIGIQFNGTTIGISAGVTGEGLGTLTKELRRVVTLVDAESEPSFDEFDKQVG
jgi:Obg family GTPase CgtA